MLKDGLLRFMCSILGHGPAIRIIEVHSRRTRVIHTPFNVNETNFIKGKLRCEYCGTVYLGEVKDTAPILWPRL